MSKIPAHATCVFKGEIFDVYQWPQQLYDGRTVTFECLKRPNTVVVVPTQGDVVFYAEQQQPNKDPYLSLFGGRVEEGEDTLEAAKRELLEESGLASDDWELFATNPFRGKIEWTVYYYIARNCQKVAEPNLDGGEIITVKTTDADTFLNQIVADPRFYEPELKDAVYSAFNPQAAHQFKSKLIS
ncbi:MAG: hypothetical protein DI585_03220 [Pseudomonas fluorescens]|nr:MAG: hypothetical protein DI585_03220 [Pseudomonas fluorescens]